MTTSMTVAISIILDWSQIGVESLIQVERNEKALKRIRLTGQNNGREEYI